MIFGKPGGDLAPAMSPRHEGFTLVELVIVVGIVAILASIAIPSYSAYVIRSKRASAVTALLQDAQYMERNYTVSGCYNSTTPPCGAPGAVLPVLPVTQAPQDGVASYGITFAGLPTLTGYTLVATPIANFSDPTCGNLLLDNAGVKSVSIVPATQALIDTCWQH